MIINVQCGYRALNRTLSNQPIYEIGCVARLESYLYVIIGVAVGLLVFLLVNILLASGLAVDVHREKQAKKVHSDREKREKRQEREMAKM